MLPGRELVWSESFWLPAGVSWRQLQRNSSGRVFKAAPSDLWVSLACGAAILAAGRQLQALVLRPLGRRCGLRDRRPDTSTSVSQQLEAAYQKRLGVGGLDCAALSARVGQSQRFVSQWLRRRRRAEAGARRLDKFADACWQLLFYSAAVAHGLAVLHNEPFLLDSKQLWRGWPEHHVSAGVYWYYMLQIGYYCAALAAVGSDAGRKDSGAMLLHHLLTLGLLALSWCLNLTRVGTVVLLLHDTADPLLNVSKLGVYLKARWLSDAAFGLFLVLWTVTRLLVYPLHLLRSVFFELDAEFAASTAVNCLRAGLLLMQLLHIFWTCFILKVLFRILAQGVRKDSRSDTEDSDGEEAKSE